jgi:endo-1,4-beta-mannosidase
MGINYVQCFWDVLKNPENHDFVEGFRILREDYQIPFIRFAASPYLGRDWKLYAENPEEYFRRLDLIVREAEKQHLGLIPSLFWWRPAVGDWCQEPLGEMGNPQSKTRAFYRKYAAEIVRRYQDSPAIWGWEIGNEYLLGADLPAPNHLPAPQPGSKKPRTAADKFTRPMILDLYQELHTAIREIDPRRLIVAGDAMLRSSAWNNRNRDDWGLDTREQSLEMFTAETPKGFSAASIHLYPEQDGKYFKDEEVSLEELLKAVVQETHRQGRAVWCGEFGAAASGPQERQMVERMLHTLKETGVELSALWNFNLPGRTFQKGIDVTPSNERAWMLSEIQKFNQDSRKQL